MSPTSGLRQSRSGWVESKRWRYHWPSPLPPAVSLLAVSLRPVREARPGRAAEDGLPVVGRLGAIRAATVAEQVAGALRAARSSGESRLEPHVLVGGVVGHQVHDHLQPQVVGRGDEGVGVGEGAEQVVDGAVVGDVVAVVVLRGGVERREPDRVDAQVAQVGQARGDPGQVADPVLPAGPGVGEAADVDLVDDCVAPPGGGLRPGARALGAHAKSFGSTANQMCSADPTTRPCES